MLVQCCSLAADQNGGGEPTAASTAAMRSDPHLPIFILMAMIADMTARADTNDKVVRAGGAGGGVGASSLWRCTFLF